MAGSVGAPASGVKLSMAKDISQTPRLTSHSPNDATHIRLDRGDRKRFADP